MSSTPRTDEQEFDWHEDCAPSEDMIVVAGFARQLERENLRLREGLEAASQFLENATSYIGVINEHDLPKAVHALNRVRSALADRQRKWREPMEGGTE